MSTLGARSGRPRSSSSSLATQRWVPVSRYAPQGYRVASQVRGKGEDSMCGRYQESAQGAVATWVKTGENPAAARRAGGKRGGMQGPCGCARGTPF